jgi:hypothetical protein
MVCLHGSSIVWWPLSVKKVLWALMTEGRRRLRLWSIQDKRWSLSERWTWRAYPLIYYAMSMGKMSNNIFIEWSITCKCMDIEVCLVFFRYIPSLNSFIIPHQSDLKFERKNKLWVSHFYYCFFFGWSFLLKAQVENYEVGFICIK